uniref:PQ-loop repeat-containing protein n=1 Tax=Salix viminalis TaxID=40686 RepID=A0A6N2K038_SALVM
MAFFKSTMPICPHHCSQWARVYMKYCLCSVKDGVSLTLGMISVLSWGVAEVPQIVTNYKKKSTEGLSLAFLLTWIIGDIFNVFGCMLEPATLPTQYYMAVGPVSSHSEEAGRIKQGNSSDAGAQVNSADKQINESAAPDGTNGLSSPIPFPTLPQKSSPERDLYYASARSLSRSHAPTVGSFLAQRMTPPSIRNSIEEPLLGEDVATQSAPNSNTKTMLCVVSVVTFLGTLNLHHSANSRLDRVFENKHQGIFIQVGRKILQTSSILSHENDNDGSGIGTFLGWSMAAIYMGGRLPQICLNIKRGKVEGLNPLMFVFALVGNITYVASILVNSLAWSKIKANQPWLVDAGGCALLDTCILLQFVYFRYSRRRAVEEKLQSSNGA